VEFDRETFVDHYESGDLTYEFGPDEQYERGTDDDSQARPADAESVADGGTVGDLSTDHIIEFETPPSNSPHQMRFPRISHSPRLPNQQ